MVISRLFFTYAEEYFDYRPSDQIITISAGTSISCIDLSLFILEDEILEDTEIFNISIYSIEPCGTVEPGITSVHITDNDS